MARDDGGAAGTVVVAFVLGAVTGAAVALLMAPASGEETRRDPRRKAREGRERATEAARAGARVREPPAGHALVGDRARPRSVPAGAQRRHASGDRRRRESVMNELVRPVPRA